MAERPTVPWIESGIELLARLSGKESFRGIEDVIFQEELRPGDVIEIAGESGAGKTMLLSRMIARCLLPSDYRNVRINCCSAAAVLINTDYHFEVSKLVDAMIGIVRETYAGSENADDEDAMKDAVLSCLHNFNVINCYNADQLSLTFHTLDNILLANKNIALLAIDSIAAYYWEEREKCGRMSMDSYVNRILKQLQTCTNHFNILTVYTRTRDRNTTNLRNMSECSLYENPSYRILLSKADDSNRLKCTVMKKEERPRELAYTICKTGVRWDQVASGKN